LNKINFTDIKNVILVSATSAKKEQCDEIIKHLKKINN